MTRRFRPLLRALAALAALLALAASPAGAAEDWRRALADGQAALEAGRTEAAIVAFQRALEGGAAGRERGRAHQGLVRALIRHKNLEAAERALDEARAFVLARFGEDDILMAGLWQLHGAIRLERHGDAEGARRAFLQARRIRNAALDHVWEKAAPPPGWRHRPSGMGFRETAGAFALAARNIDDDEGNEVAATYRGVLASGAVTATVSVARPRGADLAAAFAREAASLRRFNPGARVLDEGERALALGARRLPGRVLALAIESDGARLGTRLYLFPAGAGFVVKLRLTYRLEDDGAADAAALALLAALDWPP